MGHKISPKAFRLNINKTWDSRWFNDTDFASVLKQDILIRKYLLKKLKEAQVSKVEIERSANQLKINIHTAKPGLIIGRGGQGVEDLKRDVHNRYVKDKFSRKHNIRDIQLNIVEIDKPSADSAVIMHQVIADLEKRVPFRRTIKQAIGRTEKAGVKGVKIMVSGRLNGAEIARTEMLFVGKIPLHTLRADIDYCRGVAQTIYGTIGVKVWIYKGDVFHDKSAASQGEAAGEHSHQNTLR